MSYSSGILKEAFGKAPQEAVEFMKSKVSKTSFDWWESLEGSHQKAFTVAKATQADVLVSIRDAVEKAFESGQTFKDFQGELEPKLRRLGWWGKDEAGNILGTPYRLENIYRTNIQQAFNAGREKRLLQSRATPFSKYVAVLDSRVRPSHLALNGIVAANDSSFWAAYSPANGYQCRCRKTGVSERQIERQGLKVSDFEGKIGSKEVPINKSKGIFGEVSTVKINGKTISPDVGFSSNPLKAWNPDLKKYPPKIAAPLKKDLKKAPKAAKAKAKKTNVEKLAKQNIKSTEKPKDLKETLKKSEEFLKPWADKIPRIKDFKLEKIGKEGKLFINGEEIFFGDFEKAKLFEEALKEKSFRLQANGVAKTQKLLGDFSEISSLKEVQNVFSKHVREVQKTFESLEDAPFLDIEILSDKVRIGSDLYYKYKIPKEQLDDLENFINIKTATDQFNFAKLKTMQEEGSHILNPCEWKARGQIEKNAFEKGKFLGYNLQETNLPEGFNPKKIKRNKLSGENENALQKRIDLAESFLKKNVSSEIIPFEKINHLKTHLNGGSSFYDPNEETITFSMKDQKADTIIHEMFHHLHFKNPRVENMVEEFFKERTKGEFLSESKLLKDNRLRDSWSDEYMGKFYFNKGDNPKNYISENGDFDFDFYKKNYKFPIGTELLTKGVQEFFFSRSDLYSRDPEFFEFISAILRGEIPN